MKKKESTVFPSGIAFGKCDIPWGNKSSYLPHNHAINVMILHKREFILNAMLYKLCLDYV